MTFTYSPTMYSWEEPTDVDRLRFLLNDVDDDTHVFEDEELTMALAMESGALKLAAAQVIDVNATNEALASKVLRTQDVQVDGAKLADALRAHADRLRAQHAAETADEDGYFEIINGPASGPELTERPWF